MQGRGVFIELGGAGKGLRLPLLLPSQPEVPTPGGGAPREDLELKPCFEVLQQLGHRLPQILRHRALPLA
jgi:hypothetical protein